MDASFSRRLILAAALALPIVSVPASGPAQEVATPNFYDQRQRLSRPVMAERSRVRFLTTVDYPPFNFLDARGRLGGFNVDLVRAICEELGILDRCQIEARPFNELVPALQAGEGEAIIAGLAVTPANRQQLEFTEPYLRYPARFVTRRDDVLAEPLAESVRGQVIGVAEGTAHEAMLRSFFPQAEVKAFASRDLALASLRDGEVAAVFGDGVGLSFWLGSESAQDCCVFSGGPYLSDMFLGEGLAIAVKSSDADLARAIDYAMGQIVARNDFSELLLRYFPISAF